MPQKPIAIFPVTLHPLANTDQLNNAFESSYLYEVLSDTPRKIGSPFAELRATAKLLAID